MNFKKVLVIKLRAMGDTVMTTATLQELRRLMPDTEIHALAPRAWASLIYNHPAVDRLWLFNSRAKGLNKIARLLRLGWRLRQQHYDAVFALHASSSTSLLARLSGAPVRSVHNHNFGKPNLYGTVEIPEKEILKPFVDRDLSALRAVGLTPNPLAQTFLKVTTQEEQWADDYLRAKNIRAPLLMLGLGASRPTKVWPMKNFAELALKWNQSTKGGSVICLGSHTEKGLFNEVLRFRNEERSKRLTPLSSAAEARNLASAKEWLIGEFSLSLRRMMALISKTQVFVGNDSGPRHVAAALGIPTVTLYGPQDPFECHPYDKTKHPYLLIEGLNCRIHSDPSGQHKWCGLYTCLERHHECMVRIKSSDVWNLTASLVKSTVV